MDNIIVYVDDAAHARQQLAGVLAQGGQRRWLVVACAPRMTQRIGKWVSHGSRENWRNKWSQKLFDQLLPSFGGGATVVPVLAKEPLPELTARLQVEHGPAQVVDARRPKSPQPAATPAEPGSTTPGRWTLPGGTSVFALFFLVME